MSGYEPLIPGTALPSTPPSRQPEGRGTVRITEERRPVSLIEKLRPRDDLTPEEHATLAAALRAFDRKPRLLKTIYDTAAAVTAAVTGNLVIPLFVSPAGCESHLTQIVVDMPSSATVQPAAPAAAAASFAYISIGSASTTLTSANADTYRQGLAWFWPNPASASGPLIPVSQTWNDKNAPVAFGGQQISYVLHGGSQAAFVSQVVQVTYRVQLFGYEDGGL